MNRTVVIVLAAFVLFSGATATAAAFTDGDEVAPGSAVYLDAADSENADRYVRFDENDEVRLEFDALPPGSQTRVDDLFVVGFDGYENSENATTVRIESTDDRIAIQRMDTDTSFTTETISFRPGESVAFGAVVSTDQRSFSGTIELEVDVPDEDTSGGGGGGSTSGSTDETGSEADSESSDGESDDGADDDDIETQDGSDDDSTAEEGDEAGSVADGNSDGADASSAENPGEPTAEPAALSFGDTSIEWSLFGGFLAAFTNYLVQTRLRDQLPVMSFDRSERRDRLKPVVLREFAIGVGVLLAALLLTGVLSEAGITGNEQVFATLLFSGALGGITGYRRFPYLGLDLFRPETQRSN